VRCGSFAPPMSIPSCRRKWIRRSERNWPKVTTTGFSDSRLFAAELTTKLREICHDGHLTVAVPPCGAARVEGGPRGSVSKQWSERERGGELRVLPLRQILPGNVGFLDLRSFSGVPQAGETTAAAMSFVANADALIIDLATTLAAALINVTGSRVISWKAGAPLRHLWPRERQNRSAFHLRVGARPPVRWHKTAVHSSPAHKTYSCAEGFAFALRGQARVTIVGEVNRRRGAHRQRAAAR